MSEDRTAERPGPSLLIRGVLAIVLSVLANVGLVLAANALGIAPGFRAVTAPPVAFLSAVGAAGAVAAYWLLGRYSDTADRTFVRVAAGVLVISFVPDVALLFADPTATPLAVVLLMVMHVVVAAAAVGFLVTWRAEP